MSDAGILISGDQVDRGRRIGRDDGQDILREQPMSWCTWLNCCTHPFRESPTIELSR
jgi:hypothetical protein